MREGDTILAQIDGEFTATADRPDFPYGPLKTGQSVTVKMLAMYRILGDKISRITPGVVARERRRRLIYTAPPRLVTAPA